MKKTFTLLLLITVNLSINAQFLSKAVVTSKATIDFSNADYTIKEIAYETIGMSFQIVENGKDKTLKIGYKQNNIIWFKEFSITNTSYENGNLKINARGFLEDYVQLFLTRTTFKLEYNLNEHYFHTIVWENYYYGNLIK